MKTIFLKSKKYGNASVLVDDDNFEALNKVTWSLAKRGKTKYAIHQVFGKKAEYMHRIIMRADVTEVVDHKDHNGLNNQKNNLRKCSDGQNKSNVSHHRDSTSKYLGVCWNKQVNKWQAQIHKNTKSYKLGFFDSENDAAVAYNERARELHGEFANLNKL